MTVYVEGPLNYINYSTGKQASYKSGLEISSLISLTRHLSRSAQRKCTSENKIISFKEEKENANKLYFINLPSNWKTMDQQNSSSQQYNSVKENERIVILVAFVLISTVGSLSNILVILQIACNRKMWKISNFYICNLGVADFLICGIISTFNVYTLTTQGTTLHICNIMSMFTTWMLITAILSLVLISVNRCLLVKFSAEKYATTFSRSRTILSVISTWSIGLICLIPLIYSHVNNNFEEIPEYCTTFSVRTSYIYQILIVTLIGLPAFAVIFISYIMVWKTFKASLNLVLPVDNFDVSRRNFKLTRNLFIISSVFTICWLPELFVTALDFNGWLPSYVIHVSALLALGHSMVNPILFMILHTKMKTGICNNCQKHFCWKKTVQTGNDK